MSIEKKLSTGTALLLANLKKETDELLKEGGADNDITLPTEQLERILEGYTTVVSTGEEVSVTPLDIEKVGNFRRDFQNAARLHVSEHGFEHMQTHEKADSYRVNYSLAEGLSVQSAFFRPGKEDQGNTNFVSITDTWEGNDEDKAIEAHLKSLSRKLVKK